MPRRGGQTYRADRRKHRGHRMHKRTRIARLLVRKGTGRDGKAWGRGAV